MSDLLEFGPFKLVLPDGDLYKGRNRIPLQQHPLTLLVLLIERQGDIVTREEIRSRVWPNGTIVEFDHSINTAVNKLRSALSDRAEKPRYIETVARRGYRFLAPVQRTGVIPQSAMPAQPSDPAALIPGTAVTHYRIEGLIGSGANGRVYRAVDLNLNRPVALKFLAEGPAADENAQERFGREARAISALDHPNICVVYEFGEHAGSRFLAMQMLEGETLADRIRKQGALDPETTIHIALQVARGVEAAHLQGIIHRDIKPANIFLTSTGQVKILDFGLAKLIGTPDAVASIGTEVAGQSMPRMTLTGTVMGTAAYMSPEQLRAEEVDARTDIFSFGLVLYEMSTGRHPFWNVPDAEVSGRLIRDPIPRASQLKTDVLPRLDDLIASALEKDRNRRIPAFSVIREALESLEREVRWPAQHKPVGHAWLKPAMAGILAAGALAAWLLLAHGTNHQPGLTVKPLTSSPGLKEHVVLSPDESHITFAWHGQDGNEDIFVQRIGSQTPVRLTFDRARDLSPAWSPDGRNIAFVRSESGRSSFYVVPSAGGAERKLGDLPVNPAGFCRLLDWSPNGEYLAVVEWKPPAAGGPALVLVSAANGTRVRQILSSTGDFLCAPAFSPDGRFLAAIYGPDFRVSDVHVVPLAGGAERRITFDARMIQGFAWTSDSASVVYSLRRTGPFGLWQASLKGGSPRTLLETGNDVVDPHVSRKGRRLVFARDMWDTNLWRVEGPEWSGPRSGPRKLIASTREDAAVDVSPDGAMLAFASARTGSFELWTARIDGSQPRQMTYFSGPETGYPRWSPDGKRIAFTSYPQGRPAIFVMPAANGTPQRRTDGEMPFWSEDGNGIYFLRSHAGSSTLR